MTFKTDLPPYLILIKDSRERFYSAGENSAAFSRHLYCSCFTTENDRPRHRPIGFGLFSVNNILLILY